MSRPEVKLTSNPDLDYVVKTAFQKNPLTEEWVALRLTANVTAPRAFLQLFWN